jgi:RHS repeat-associated protein
LTNDHLGSPRITTDKNGKVFSRRDFMPFGEEIDSSVTSQRSIGHNYGEDGIRQKFTSYERDNETDLDFAQARYYGYSYGRFISPDDFLNDTKVFEPVSWNLYVYARNNPLFYIDPTGEEVDGTDLTPEQRKKLIDDWKKKTGYKKIYFAENNKLTIDTAAGYKKGSATARRELLAAATSQNKIFNLKAVDGTPLAQQVAFARNVGTETRIDNITGARTDVYETQIDFGDFKQLKGDKAAKKAFSIGLVVIHEFEHGLREGEPTGSDSPNSSSDPGPLERTYINPIRRELGLAQRVTYSGVLQATGKHAGFVELKFRNAKRKDKILRWKDSVVGGRRR